MSCNYTLIFAITISFFSAVSPAQGIMEENFDYLPGKLSQVSDDWVENPTGSLDIEVIEGNLGYDGYSLSNIGNTIYLNGGASGRSGIRTNFPDISGNGNAVYISFLLNVISSENLDLQTSNGDYLGNLKFGTSTNRVYIYIKKGTSDSNFSLGIAKSSSSNLQYIEDSNYQLNQTYLIVVAYIFQAGRDAARIWINPPLQNTEPEADLEISSGTDSPGLNGFQFRQNSKSGDMIIDGLSIADSWDGSPLPVELSSFSAKTENEIVKLKWKTTTEINNYGFKLERSIDENVWIELGFLSGSGNSSVSREYSFVDDTIVPSNFYYYRLKQIDFNGNVNISKTIIVLVDSKSEFNLFQNFPNPFNPETRITFTIPGNGRVKLDVYNLLGEHINSLVDKTMTRGTHTYLFNGSQFAAGVYYYKLLFNKSFRVKKMIMNQ